MSKVWLILLVSGLGSLIFIDPSSAITAMTTGSHNAVQLSMRLVALYALWLGFFAILEKTGIARLLAKILRPLVRFLFPNSSDETNQYITLNMSANMLGLGNAATPMAIKAIGSMESENGIASINMIMMVVISSTSLQLLPTTVIGLRNTHGSANPADFLLAGFAATVVSTIVGVSLVKLWSFIVKRWKNRKRKEKTK